MERILFKRLKNFILNNYLYSIYKLIIYYNYNYNYKIFKQLNYYYLYL